jgi:hypothetical protein
MAGCACTGSLPLQESATRPMVTGVKGSGANKFGRARRAEGSQAQVPTRAPVTHPDAARATRRMPYEQLRQLVVMLIEPDEPDPEDGDPASEFESQPTMCLPRPPRTNTLDELIAALRSAPPAHSETSRPRTRKRM